MFPYRLSLNVIILPYYNLLEIILELDFLFVFLAGLICFDVQDGATLKTGDTDDGLITELCNYPIGCLV